MLAMRVYHKLLIKKRNRSVSLKRHRDFKKRYIDAKFCHDGTSMSHPARNVSAMLQIFCKRCKKVANVVVARETFCNVCFSKRLKREHQTLFQCSIKDSHKRCKRQIETFHWSKYYVASVTKFTWPRYHNKELKQLRVNILILVIERFCGLSFI